MPIRVMLLLLILIAAGACSAVKDMNARNDFEERSKSFNRMLRWRELEMAGVTFPDESMKKEFADRVKAAERVQIADYRVKSQECSLEKQEGKVVIDIDYYIPPSITLKTVEYVQRWEYVGEEGKKTWRLMSLLPEFK